MIILKNDLGDFIYLDVVTQYSRSFKSQVSQHPVDGSGTVSDNVTIQNPRLQIVGNITGADFNSGKPQLSPEDRAFVGINQIVVESDIASIIEVNYDNNPSNLFADVSREFFSDSLPEIENLNEGRDAVYSEKVLFEILKKFQRRKEKLSVYEFDNNTVSGQPIENVFIVNLSVNETATTGDALAFDITLEQVTISNLLREEIPEDVQQDLRAKNEEEQSKGEKSTESVDSDQTGLTRDTSTDSGYLSLFGNGIF